MGVRDTFDTLKRSLEKTRQGIFGKVGQLLSSKGTVDDDMLERLEEALIGADVGVTTSLEVIDAVRQRIREQGRNRPDDVLSTIKGEIERLLRTSEPESGFAVHGGGSPKPFVILVVGVNGAGKTTTIGKLAHRYRSDGKTVIIAAADTFRAAANEQLEVWAKRAGAILIRQGKGSDPAAVAFDAVTSATARGVDVVIVDTAGRLHTQVNLMEELRKVRRVIQKIDPAMPHEVLLVIDASTGQNGLQQARLFGAAVSVSGLVLTKLDGTAKGGIVLAILRELKIPVRYIGVGEGIDDLQPFDPATFVDAMVSP
jgi:fused signal recognition particle receptor